MRPVVALTPLTATPGYDGNLTLQSHQYEDDSQPLRG